MVDPDSQHPLGDPRDPGDSRNPGAGRHDASGGAPLDPGGRRPVPTGRNRVMVQWFGGLITISLLIAAQASMPLAVALLSALLLVASGSIGLVGLFADDQPSAEHFTRWDVAAWLAMLSVLVGYFADRTAVDAGITLRLF